MFGKMYTSEIYNILIFINNTNNKFINNLRLYLIALQNVLSYTTHIDLKRLNNKKTKLNHLS